MGGKEQDTEIIWSQKSAHKGRVNMVRMLIIGGVIIISFYNLSTEKIIITLWQLLPLIIIIVSSFLVSGRSKYTLTPFSLKSSILIWFEEWSSPLEEIREIAVTYTEEDEAKGTGTIILYTASGTMFMSGVYGPADVADQILFHSQRRLKELNIRTDQPDLPEKTEIKFKHDVGEAVFNVRMHNSNAVILFILSLLSAIAMAGFIYIYVATFAGGPLWVSLIAGSAAAFLAFLISGLFYLRQRLRVAVTSGQLEIRYIPSLFKTKRSFAVDKVRNLLAVGPAGMLLSAAEVISTWEEIKDIPFFPELHEIGEGSELLAFDYGAETITFGENSVLHPDEVVFLLWHLGKLLPECRTERLPENGQRVEIYGGKGETFIQAKPKRGRRRLLLFSVLAVLGIVVGAGFLILSLALPGRGGIGEFTWFAALLGLGGTGVFILSAWFLVFELANAQSIRANNVEVSRKASVWPFNKEKVISTEDINALVIVKDRLYLNYRLNEEMDFELGEFFIGWMRKGDLIRVANLLKQKYQNKIEVPDDAEIIGQTRVP